MIDLRQKGLPNAIIVDGSPFLINTDFRVWIKFSEMVKSGKVKADDLEFLFVKEMPLVDFSKEILEFFENKNSVPRQRESSTDAVIDYIIDGEYIVSSFMQAYGIDLTTCDMHWHLFKALLVGLPNDTKMKEIISMRSWKKSTKKEEQIRQELKDDWALPRNDVSQETISEINDLFYNS